ncbi:LOW QUALITY PROTEIN: translation initiation factor IF-2-like [Peromyscus leucopus]|uniref:LOW QUALITY PROTEIN: translation initiation factor IF-2-like n=1 Tax=Peromyscus leucopus TaxID=10041 RepID=UPI001884C425|nr:LOW QUALITY PROTEIN: translation initiation factor IF-2-like [Peromyscus leucopus]
MDTVREPGKTGWEDWAFESTARMLQGLVTPGDSDFPLPFPKSLQTVTHSRGSPPALLPASTGQAGCTSLCPSERRVTPPWWAQLGRWARRTPTPPPAQPQPPSSAGAEPGRQGAHCRRGAHRLSGRQRHCLRVPTPFHLRFLPRLRGARPQPPGLPARPARLPFGPLRPGPRTPEVGVGSRGARPAPRCRPGTASGITHSGLHRSAPPRVRSGLTCPAR